MSTFVDTIKRNLSLDNVLVLTPSAEGRTLECSHNNAFSWAVSDFTVPFSHVLQNQKTKVLNSTDLMYWNDSKLFNSLTARMTKEEGLVIHPLPFNCEKAHSLLVLIGNLQSNDGIQLKQKAIEYINVFIFQLTMLEDVYKKEKTQSELSEYLITINNETKKQENLNRLAMTLRGESKGMQALRRRTVNAAETDFSILIQGETGTGKELVADAIHQFSKRNNGKFVAINCAAIPETLLESELFGYVKGAFSGAEKNKQGLIALADNGTLFLDEIGDMPLSLQAKLLRVLETKCFRPIGGDKEQSSNFRLVSATHIALMDKVKSKEFRKDLYYRLLQYPLVVPTLKSRKEDIEQLSDHFINSYNQSANKNIKGLTLSAIDYLTSRDFPGNVRELKHLIQFGCAQTSNNMQIDVSHLIGLHEDEDVSEIFPQEEVFNSSKTDPLLTLSINLDVIDDLKQAIHDFESQIIQARLIKYDGNRAKVAKSLGLPKRTLTYKCQKLEILEE